MVTMNYSFKPILVKFKRQTIPCKVVISFILRFKPILVKFKLRNVRIYTVISICAVFQTYFSQIQTDALLTGQVPRQSDRFKPILVKFKLAFEAC